MNELIVFFDDRRAAKWNLEEGGGEREAQELEQLAEELEEQIGTKVTCMGSENTPQEVSRPVEDIL